MTDYFKDLLSSADLAEATGRSQRQVQKITGELIRVGMAKKVGKVAVFHRSAIQYICGRPTRRGKAAPVKEKIRRNFIEAGIKHPEVWCGYSSVTHKNGWHFREFGGAEDIYLGKSYKDYLRRENEK